MCEASLSGTQRVRRLWSEMRLDTLMGARPWGLWTCFWECWFSTEGDKPDGGWGHEQVDRFCWCQPLTLVFSVSTSLHAHRLWWWHAEAQDGMLGNLVNFRRQFEMLFYITLKRIGGKNETFIWHFKAQMEDFKDIFVLGQDPLGSASWFPCMGLCTHSRTRHLPLIIKVFLWNNLKTIVMRCHQTLLPRVSSPHRAFVKCPCC